MSECALEIRSMTHGLVSNAAPEDSFMKTQLLIMPFKMNLDYVPKPLNICIGKDEPTILQI